MHIFRSDDLPGVQFVARSRNVGPSLYRITLGQGCGASSTGHLRSVAALRRRSVAWRRVLVELVVAMLVLSNGHAGDSANISGMTV